MFYPIVHKLSFSFFFLSTILMKGYHIFLAPIRDTLEVCGFYDAVPKSNFFPTIHDAVLAASSHRHTQTLSAAIDSPKIDKQHFFLLEDGIPSSSTIIPPFPLSQHNLQIEIRPEHWESRKNLDVHDDV
uniref:STAS domain-containing protein n=1 Tax=Panagrolaimus superbus TaxID=310955 RepID=A0A914YYU9_9BILA